MVKRCPEQLVFPLLLLLLHCGYSTRSLLPSHLRTVAIASIENFTTQPGLAEEIGIILPRVFNSDRSLRVTNVEQADLIISLMVVNFSRTPAAYDADQNISAYEITLSAEVEAVDQIRNEPFFSGLLTSRISYNPENKNEEDVRREAVEKLCREVVRQVITKW